jgi:hypothetical protein
LKEELNKCQNQDGITKYNGTINIISDPEYLVACYNIIKGNPGLETGIERKESLISRKSNLRPRNIGTPREVQKAITLILETIYEPIFFAHGLRPNKGVHSALYELHLKGGNYT